MKSPGTNRVKYKGVGDAGDSVTYFSLGNCHARIFRDSPNFGMITAGTALRLPHAARFAEPKSNVSIGHVRITFYPGYNREKTINFNEIATLPNCHLAILSNAAG